MRPENPANNEGRRICIDQARDLHAQGRERWLAALTANERGARRSRACDCCGGRAKDWTA
jgi:hypothetical protein